MMQETVDLVKNRKRAKTVNYREFYEDTADEAKFYRSLFHTAKKLPFTSPNKGKSWAKSKRVPMSRKVVKGKTALSKIKRNTKRRTTTKNSKPVLPEGANVLMYPIHTPTKKDDLVQLKLQSPAHDSFSTLKAVFDSYCSLDYGVAPSSRNSIDGIANYCIDGIAKIVSFDHIAETVKVEETDCDEDYLSVIGGDFAELEKDLVINSVCTY